MHLDHHVERAVRAVHRPVLVVCGEAFVPRERLVIAFDGSPIAASPLLLGLPLVLAMAAPKELVARESLMKACRYLRAAGFDVTAELHQGKPREVPPHVLTSHAAGLPAMGAYGHGHIREFVLGSTMTALLRCCAAALLRSSSVPVLVLL